MEVGNPHGVEEGPDRRRRVVLLFLPLSLSLSLS